jgi:uncharacterized protein YfiM (DUF2279 family)
MNELAPIVLAFRIAVGSQAAAPPPDKWFAEDKLQHYFMSFATTQLAAGAARAAGFERSPSLAVGVAAGASAGLWKEWRDRRRGGPFSTRDLVWDAAGIASGVVVMKQLKDDNAK